MTAKRPSRVEPRETAREVAAFIQSPASFQLSQKMALEAARFWARRMRAYADQMDALANCDTSEKFVAAQQTFLERMRADYSEETEQFSALLNGAAKDAAEKRA
ncbi:MAG: hypothetical protein AB7L65_07005 [Hyphomonadaceae bacterium]